MSTTEHIAEDLRPLAQPIDLLKLLPGNPRRGDVEAVMRSYDRFGQRKPIVARRDGTVIAGNHQLQAAQRLGWSHMAVVWTDDDDLTAKAFALADNRTADLGAYDEASLLQIIKEVSNDPALLADTSWGQEAITELQAQLGEGGFGAADDDHSIPIGTGELLDIIDVTLGDPRHTVNHGDVYLLDGKHYLIVADLHREHALWRSYLDKKDDAVFLPYPEPMITLSPGGAAYTMVMVQPNTYLAGHLLDRHVDVKGEGSVVKQ
jgi:hypothetical protein